MWSEVCDLFDKFNKNEGKLVIYGHKSCCPHPLIDFEMYGVQDLDTGVLISNITNPNRKFWQRLGNAKSAIARYEQRCKKQNIKAKRLRVVKLRVVEINE